MNDCKKLIGFLIVWMGSGLTLSAYQNDEYIIAIIFTLLSTLYFVIV